MFSSFAVSFTAVAVTADDRRWVSAKAQHAQNFSEPLSSPSPHKPQASRANLRPHDLSRECATELDKGTLRVFRPNLRGKRTAAAAAGPHRLREPVRDCPYGPIALKLRVLLQNCFRECHHGSPSEITLPVEHSRLSVKGKVVRTLIAECLWERIVSIQ